MEKLPKYVRIHKGQYVWRPFLGRVDGKIKWGRQITLCPADSSLSQVWQAYETADLVVEKPPARCVRPFPDLPPTHTLNAAYYQAKRNAKNRGIPFLFGKDEWYEWWGEDIHKRGIKKDSLCMGRYGDTGAYEPSNVYKCTLSENTVGPR